MKSIGTTCCLVLILMACSETRNSEISLAPLNETSKSTQHLIPSLAANEESQSVSATVRIPVTSVVRFMPDRPNNWIRSIVENDGKIIGFTDLESVIFDPSQQTSTSIEYRFAGYRNGEPAFSPLMGPRKLRILDEAGKPGESAPSFRVRSNSDLQNSQFEGFPSFPFQEGPKIFARYAYGEDSVGYAFFDLEALREPEQVFPGSVLCFSQSGRYVCIGERETTSYDTFLIDTVSQEILFHKKEIKVGTQDFYFLSENILCVSSTENYSSENHCSDLLVWDIQEQKQKSIQVYSELMNPKVFRLKDGRMLLVGRSEELNDDIAEITREPVDDIMGHVTF